MATIQSIPTGPKFKNLTGQSFGILTVLRWDHKAGNGVSYWLCRCVCGTEKRIAGCNLRAGQTSCGCQRGTLDRVKKLRHGCSRTTLGGGPTPEFRVWSGMLARCSNPNAPSYEYYGGRGITVCDRWRDSFETFLADMGPRPGPRHSIDRYPDRNGNYEPGNCRWATDKEQQRNRGNLRFITFAGKTQCLAAWAEEAGLSRGALQERLARGWDMAKAISEPSRQGRTP
jgi:hypothetical protein